MSFDFKKEYKEFYMPKDKPEIITVPKMNYIAVRGKGNPNDEAGEYKAAIGLLYGIAFTIKMSNKGDHQIDGYFDYVVPSLEGKGSIFFYGKIRFLMLLSLVLKLKSIDFSGLRGFRCYFYYYQSQKSIDSPDFCSF